MDSTANRARSWGVIFTLSLLTLSLAAPRNRRQLGPQAPPPWNLEVEPTNRPEVEAAEAEAAFPQAPFPQPWLQRNANQVPFNQNAVRQAPATGAPNGVQQAPVNNNVQAPPSSGSVMVVPPPGAVDVPPQASAPDRAQAQPINSPPSPAPANFNPDPQSTFQVSVQAPANVNAFSQAPANTNSASQVSQQSATLNTGAPKTPVQAPLNANNNAVNVALSPGRGRTSSLQSSRGTGTGAAAGAEPNQPPEVEATESAPISAPGGGETVNQPQPGPMQSAGQPPNLPNPPPMAPWRYAPYDPLLQTPPNMQTNNAAGRQALPGPNMAFHPLAGGEMEQAEGAETAGVPNAMPQASMPVLNNNNNNNRFQQPMGQVPFGAEVEAPQAREVEPAETMAGMMGNPMSANGQGAAAGGQRGAAPAGQPNWLTGTKFASMPPWWVRAIRPFMK